MKIATLIEFFIIFSSGHLERVDFIIYRICNNSAFPSFLILLIYLYQKSDNTSAIKRKSITILYKNPGCFCSRLFLFIGTVPTHTVLAAAIFLTFLEVGADKASVLPRYSPDYRCIFPHHVTVSFNCFIAFFINIFTQGKLLRKFYSTLSICSFRKIYSLFT